MKTKYPKELRFKWYLWVEKHKHTVKETCKMFGIPRKIYYYWYPNDHGLENNTYYNKKPHPHLKLTPEVKKFIEEEKKKTNYGPLKMSILVKRKVGISLSPNLIYRFYKRKGLIRKPQKRLPWYKPIKEPIKVTKPGEGVQVDIKYVFEDGQRKYFFSVLDTYTEKYYGRTFQTKHSQNRITVHQEAENYFGFKIISIQSDNGSENRGEYHNWLEKNNIPHYFIPKSSPNWNAQVERIHKTIDDEYYLNPDKPWNNLREWLNYYNFERIHLTLGGLTPHEKLLKYVTIEC